MGDGTSKEILARRLTRRGAITAVAMGWSGMALNPIAASGESEDEISHIAEAIHQENTFKASRKRVYEALTATAQFDKVIEISGAKKSTALGTKPTQISGEPGGAFVIFGGHIVGRQIDLVPNERIIQAWRVVDWEPGVYSIARFELTEQGAGTKIVFDHTGFPKGLGSHLAEGWRLHYWEPLQKFLA
jgi:activator of HSP90 ATPase